MATGCGHPRAYLKDLNTHVIPHIPADKWKDLGLELLDAETGAAELNHIKADNPEIHQRCEAMFEKWLLGRNATWNKLIAALQKVGLIYLADNIKKTFIPMTEVLPAEHAKSEGTNTDMISRAEEASAEFGVLLSKILEVLIKNKTKSLHLLKSICSTLTIKNDSKIQIFSVEELEKIIGCLDVEDLFLIKLRNYWRWDDFSVLSTIVSSLNSKKCELLLDQFEKKIDAKLKLIEIYEQCKKENDFPKGFHKMVAITKKSFSIITRKEYKELKKFVADNCGVESCAISPFIKASQSSLMLEWYIPGAAVAYMAEIASVNNQNFIDHGFVYLKLTKSVIFDQLNSKRKTALHFATEQGNVSIAKILIKSGVDVNAVDDDGKTALHNATKWGHVSVAENLIRLGANTNAVDEAQATPLIIAAQNGHVGVVDMLLAHGANVNHTTVGLGTALHFAAYFGHLAVVKLLTAHKADVNSLNKFGKTPLNYAVQQEKSDVVKFFVEEVKMDTTKLDHDIQQQIAALEMILEKSKTEMKLAHSGAKITVSKHKLPASVTHEEINDSYIDGCLPIVDPRVVLLGCEGSGKTSLIDTFVGSSFRNTSPTEGADQLKISVTTAADWKIMNEKENLTDLKKQALLESKFFVLLKKWCISLETPSPAQPPSINALFALAMQQILSSVSVATPTMPIPSTSTDEPLLSTVKRDDMAEPPKSLPRISLNPRSLPGKFHKKLVYITKGEFQQLKTIKQKYNPRRRYVHLWDFAGQQIFHHMHGLFVSEDVVCLIVFNAGKSLFTVPDKRYPDDITPAKSAIEVICYYMEMISAHVSKRSTEGDDLSEFLPTFILIGTHIDELHTDIKVAIKLAFQRFVPALIKELESKPFAKHIAGSKNNRLFAEGSSSIFFISNKDEMRDPLVIGKIKRVIFKAASITKQSRPIRLVEMERRFILLTQQDKVNVIDKHMAKEVAESCGLSCSDQELVNFLNYFHQKGILLHFHKVPALSNMIILSPQWLAKLLMYVLTTLKCQPVGPPLAPFARKLQTTGLLEQELLEWSLQEFIKDEEIKGHKMMRFTDSDVTDLLINFKLMANVSNTSLVGQNPRLPGQQLFLVPHLLPKEELVHSKAFGYRFFYYFPAKFIPEHLVDQLIVKCAEWNRSKQYDILRLSYHWVCLELGKHQIYELSVMFDHSVIALKIIPDPNLSSEVREKAFADSNELVRSVKMFIDDLMREHMAATFAKAPVVCYIPCSQCKKMHLNVEKATMKSNIYCPVSRVHADITNYNNILSAHLSKKSEMNSSNDMIKSASTDHNKPAASSDVAQVSQPINSEHSKFLDQAPKMKHLNKYVILKIAAEWKKVADSLEFDIHTIRIIEKKFHNYHLESCDEMLGDWLSTDVGLKPKVWSTLIAALKDVKQLTAAVEEIKQDIKHILH